MGDYENTLVGYRELYRGIRHPDGVFVLVGRNCTVQPWSLDGSRWCLVLMGSSPQWLSAKLRLLKAAVALESTITQLGDTEAVLTFVSGKNSLECLVSLGFVVRRRRFPHRALAGAALVRSTVKGVNCQKS